LILKIAGGEPRLRFAQIGGGIFRSDHGENRNAVAPPRAKERVDRLPGGAADQIVERDVDGRLGRAIAVHRSVHRRRRTGKILGRAVAQSRRQVIDRRHHAGDRFARHGRRRSRLAPAHHAVVGFDAQQHIVGPRDSLAGHLHRLVHRQTDRDRLDCFNSHAVSRFRPTGLAGRGIAGSHFYQLSAAMLPPVGCIACGIIRP
jgi:hypothetical protein